MNSGPAVDYAAIIAAPDRSEADRRNDARRKAVELLAFTGVRPGMKVLDLATGGGYSTELMARAAGPTAVVYGQDSPTTIAGARTAFDNRAKSLAMKNVIRLIRSFDDPVPADVHDFDVITFFFEYHEMPKAGIDFAKMNRRLFEILKPGGVLVIADHSALAGTGGEVGPTLHRIEEAFDLQIPDQDLGGLTTVGHVVSYVEKRLGKTASAAPAKKPVTLKNPKSKKKP